MPQRKQRLELHHFFSMLMLSNNSAAESTLQRACVRGGDREWLCLSAAPCIHFCTFSPSSGPLEPTISPATSESLELHTHSLIVRVDEQRQCKLSSTWIYRDEDCHRNFARVWGQGTLPLACANTIAADASLSFGALKAPGDLPRFRQAGLGVTHASDEIPAVSKSPLKILRRTSSNALRRDEPEKSCGQTSSKLQFCGDSSFGSSSFLTYHAAVEPFSFLPLQNLGSYCGYPPKAGPARLMIAHVKATARQKVAKTRAIQ